MYVTTCCYNIVTLNRDDIIHSTWLQRIILFALWTFTRTKLTSYIFYNKLHENAKIPKKRISTFEHIYMYNNCYGRWWFLWYNELDEHEHVDDNFTASTLNSTWCYIHVVCSNMDCRIHATRNEQWALIVAIPSTMFWPKICNIFKYTCMMYTLYTYQRKLTPTAQQRIISSIWALDLI